MLRLLRRAAHAALLLAPATLAAQDADTAVEVRSSSGAFRMVARGAMPGAGATGIAAFTGVDGRRYVYVATVACAACEGARVYVWDVTDALRPALTDSLAVDARVVSDVAVNPAGTVAVLSRQGAAALRNGLVFLDLAQPAHPRVAGEFWETLVAGARQPVWDGSLVYVVDAASNEMVSIDASNLADPRQVGRWGLPAAPDRELNHVAVRDGLAYLSYDLHGLVVVDVGDGVRGGTARRPRQVAQHFAPVEWRGLRRGRTRWVLPAPDSAGELIFVGTDLVAAPGVEGRGEGAATVHVVDVANPAAPRVVAYYNLPGASVRSLALAGDTLLVAGWRAGVRALDVRHPLRGELRGRDVGTLPTAGSGAGQAWDVQALDGVVFATDVGSGLWVAQPVAAAGP